MLQTRRSFLTKGYKMGLAAATAPLWNNALAKKLLAEAGSSYKAVVIVSLAGGNDGNNMFVPLDNARYTEYAQSRGALALSAGSCIPVNTAGSTDSYGFHYYMPNVAAMYNSRRASVVANIGPITQPATKQQLLANPALVPPSSLFSHPSSINQWMSSSTGVQPPTGWGGRIADIIIGQSGSVPPVLNAGPSSLFTVGQAVQGIAVQPTGNGSSLPAAMNSVILQAANADAESTNLRVMQSAKLRQLALQGQLVLLQAQQYGTLRTQFPTSAFGGVMQTIASIINGRSVTGASRQIFYAEQGSYDTHQNQAYRQADCFNEFDQVIAPFFAALDEMGLSDQVLVCTHSDFGRSFASNSTGGTDHGWGNHQLVFGGGVSGGRIFGQMPDPVLGGNDDINLSGMGLWIPTTGVTQLTAGIGSWLGLNGGQLSQVFPDLVKFPDGMVRLT